MAHVWTHIEEIVSSAPIIFHEVKDWTLSVITVFAFGRADALKPGCAFVFHLDRALTEVPHPVFVTDLFHCSAVGNVFTVVCAFIAWRKDDTSSVTATLVALQAELNASLKWQGIVIERKQYNLIETTRYCVVNNLHLRSSA